MNRRQPTWLAMLAVATLAVACSSPGASASSAASQAASVAPPASEAPASVAASEAASAAPSEATGDTAQVTLTGSSFSVPELTIAAGTTVVFTNQGTFDHTVTHGTGGVVADDPIVNRAISPQGQVSVTFDEPGEYQITCTIHPSMNMKIIVEG